MIGRFVLLGIVLFHSAAAFGLERIETSRPYLGTVVNIVACYSPEQQERVVAAIDAVWDIFEHSQAHMNAFDPASDISMLNNAAGQEVIVHDDVYALLMASREYAVLTGGVFDVTVGPLIALWRSAAEKDAIPSLDAIRQRKHLVDARRMELLGDGKVRLPVGMKVDVGGDAAGFLADKGAKVFRSYGFQDFLIDAGGEIYASGVSCQGRAWRVGVRDPQDPDGRKWILKLEDSAVSTSGSYAKYFTIKGERWSHIINPVTGYPQRDILSATVVAPTALEADVLSTALCVLGPREGFRLLDRLGSGYAAMLFFRMGDGRVQKFMSRGYKQLMVEKL